MACPDLCFTRVTAQQASEDGTEQGLGSRGAGRDETGETFRRRDDRTGCTSDGKSNREKSTRRDRCALRFLAWVENDATSFPRLKSQEENLVCGESYRALDTAESAGNTQVANQKAVS